MNKIGYLYGMKLIKSESMVIESNIPKRIHKQKRIQKKYIKKYGFKMVPDTRTFVMDGMIVGHPKIIDKIIKSIE